MPLHYDLNSNISNYIVAVFAAIPYYVVLFIENQSFDVVLGLVISLIFFILGKVIDFFIKRYLLNIELKMRQKQMNEKAKED